ncbi:hypothetical protein [Streptomyces aureocirculatus]|uniref:hypothetical protein n=1 Tax=Streptomyces aureocirculatus TaxID=67275 RepID=UPI000A523ACC|nr:hypothetical protein [Streptomyces aureocirculatus]
MRRTGRYLLFAADTGVSILAVTAVHGVAHLPFAIAVYVDAVVGLCWFLVAALLLRRLSPDSPVDDASGSGRERAVRFSTESEPLARSHWGSRYRH